MALAQQPVAALREVAGEIDGRVSPSSSQPKKIVSTGPIALIIEVWLEPMRRMPSAISQIGAAVDTAAIASTSQYTSAG